MNVKMNLSSCLYCDNEVNGTVEICHECSKKIQLISHVSKKNQMTLTIIAIVFFLIIGISIIVLMIYMNVFPLKKQFDDDEQFYFFFFLLGSVFIQMMLGGIAIERGSIATQKKLSQGLMKEKYVELKSLGTAIIILYSIILLICLFFLVVIFPLLGMWGDQHYKIKEIKKDVWRDFVNS